MHDSPWEGPFGPSPVRARRRAATQLLVRRSILIVPANVENFIKKAHTRNADAVMIDLEDSIPENEKTAARVPARAAIDLVGRGGADVLVRVNKPFELLIADLDAVVVPGLDTVMMPKVESAREVAILDALITEREIARGLPRGGITLHLALESSNAVLRATEILEASERVVNVAYGAEDVIQELGVETTPEGDERFLGNALVILAANAAGVQPLGRPGNPFNFDDVDGQEASARKGFALGFKGASCIHPLQVEPLNRGYMPSPKQIEKAHRTIEIMAEATARGRASASLDGRMIDIPSATRAEGLVTRVKAIEEKDARKNQMATPV